MKVVAINGSPHKDGNTYSALKMVGNILEKSGIEFSIIHVGNKQVRGCIACGQCIKRKDEKCAITTDSTNEWIQEMKNADGIVIGSPVHFSGIAGTMKSFLDRAFYVSGVNGGLFRHKVGASVVAVRRSGGTATFDSLNHYLTYAEMIMATSNYWNVVHGRIAGEAEQDAEGVQVMEVLGNSILWLLKMKEYASEAVESPQPTAKIMTSFIR
jgi:multimeric flavodoxin WrbA